MMKPQILFCTLAIVMFGSTVYAQDADNDGYHDGDVAVIKAMVENNGYRLRSEMPDHWADWNFETPKRIEELSINYYDNRPEKPLTGVLDVSKLDRLTRLDCNNNLLTGLNVSGLTRLTYLGCQGNQLTTLDLSGCSVLKDLYCDDNRLTTLNISGVTQLLNMTCRDNPINRIVLKNDRTLNIASAPNEGGSIAA